MNLLTCFNIDLYRDALCKIGNEMHDDHRYSQLSPCAHAGKRTSAKFPFHYRLLLSNKDTNLRS